jgi:hypothetical protein
MDYTIPHLITESRLYLGEPPTMGTDWKVDLVSADSNGMTAFLHALRPQLLVAVLLGDSAA